MPALFFAAAVALIAGWATRRWGVLAGSIAALVMVTHPMTIELSRQVRGYSLALLAATVSTLLAARLLRHPRDMWVSVGYIVAIATGIATHLYVGAMVLGHVGLVLSYRKLSWWWMLRWTLGVGLGLLAYVAIPPRNVRRGFQPSFPADAAWDLLGATLLSVVVLGACTAVFVVFHRRLWLMIALPILATVYVWWREELATIHPRYFLWAIPGVAVAAAWGVEPPTLVRRPDARGGDGHGRRRLADRRLRNPRRGRGGCRGRRTGLRGVHRRLGGDVGIRVARERVPWRRPAVRRPDQYRNVATRRLRGHPRHPAVPGRVRRRAVAAAVDIANLIEGSGDGSVLAGAPTAEPLLLNDNGGWSWFEDERVVIDSARCRLLVSSAVDAGGDEPTERDGDVEVVAYDQSTSIPVRSTLHDGQIGDDHNSAALYMRSDGRYVAMYSLHDTDSLTRWRVSRRPGDVTEWESERVLDNGAPTSYSNIYSIGEEARLYAFIRSEGRDPHFLVSDDDGSSWSAGGQLLDSPDRPYVRYVSDGVGRIHLIATEGVPRESTGVYHGVIEGGQLHRSDGTVVDARPLRRERVGRRSFDAGVRR